MAIETLHWKASDLAHVNDMPDFWVCSRRVYVYTSDMEKSDSINPITSILFNPKGEDCCRFHVEYEAWDPIDSDVCEYLTRLMILYDPEATAFKAAVSDGVWRLSAKAQAIMDHVLKNARSYRECAAALLQGLNKLEPFDIVYEAAGSLQRRGPGRGR